jgi:hypothetical protein
MTACLLKAAADVIGLELKVVRQVEENEMGMVGV